MLNKQDNQYAFKKNEHCTTCFKIICKQCCWEPDAEEVKQIQRGALTQCPKCGWSPSGSIVSPRTTVVK